MDARVCCCYWARSGNIDILKSWFRLLERVEFDRSCAGSRPQRHRPFSYSACLLSPSSASTTCMRNAAGSSPLARKRTLTMTESLLIPCLSRNFSLIAPSRSRRILRVSRLSLNIHLTMREVRIHVVCPAHDMACSTRLFSLVC